MVMYDRIGAVVNRVSNPEYEKLIEIPGVELLAFIENDGDHAANDIQGKSVFALPEDSKVLSGAREALRKLEIL
jgi:CO dehydrogenase maturation factor